MSKQIATLVGKHSVLVWVLEAENGKRLRDEENCQLIFESEAEALRVGERLGLRPVAVWSF